MKKYFKLLLFCLLIVLVESLLANTKPLNDSSVQTNEMFFLTYDYEVKDADFCLVTITIQNQSNYSALIQEDEWVDGLECEITWREANEKELNSIEMNHTMQHCCGPLRFIILPAQGSYTFDVRLKVVKEISVESVRCCFSYVLFPFNKPYDSLNKIKSDFIHYEKISTIRKKTEVTNNRVVSLHEKQNNVSFLEEDTLCKTNLLSVSLGYTQDYSQYSLRVMAKTETALLVPLLKQGLKGTIDYETLDGKKASVKIEFAHKDNDSHPRLNMLSGIDKECASLGLETDGDEISNEISFPKPKDVKKIEKIRGELGFLPLPLDAKYNSITALQKGFEENRYRFEIDLCERGDRGHAEGHPFVPKTLLFPGLDADRR